MSERIDTQIVKVNQATKASKLIPDIEATKCNESRFYYCFQYDKDSEIYNDSPNGKILPSTRVGLCKLTDKPCLNAAEQMSTIMID